ncbi:MAG TPA: hypothetical protein VHS80_06450, partial [Chthoniobacterales bacterium]|nr:hypothetical protein [Chthoniobacterales bacterium]
MLHCSPPATCTAILLPDCGSIEAEVPFKLKFRSSGIVLVLVVVLLLGALVFCPWKPDCPAIYLVPLV